MTAFVCSAWQQRPQHAICWSLPGHYRHYLVRTWSLPGHYLVTSHNLAPAARKPWGHLSQCRFPLFSEVLAPSSAFGKGMGRRVALSFLDGSNIFLMLGGLFGLYQMYPIDSTQVTSLEV